jgi:multidrug resistance protein, MATE family
MSSPSYQLTKHPIGSLREIWTLSWPLMLGLLSGSLMMFADRLLLARYSPAALNATATAGMATYILMIIPLILAGISEVFVGRHHGADQKEEAGKPVWQMLWLSLFTWPLFYFGSTLMPSVLFAGTGNEVFETLYFQWILFFAPFFCSTVALIGFFVGIGHVTTVTICALIGNVINIGLDVIFIFGWGPFPEMGIKGAALATGLSQLFQTLYLLALFLQASYRRCYGTAQWKFNLSCFKESLRIGAPAGFSRFFEVIAHFLFFRIAAMAGQDNLTILVVAQSFYMLMAFIIEGLSKGVSSIAANLIGGNQQALLDKMLKSARTLQLLFFAVLTAAVLEFPNFLLAFFFSESESALLYSPAFHFQAQWALFWMSFFFLFDGFGWIYLGVLTASGDTKFLLYAGIVLNWICYILPAYLLFAIAKGNAAQGWMLIAAYAMITFLTYWWRYRSNKWQYASQKLTSTLAEG